MIFNLFLILLTRQIQTSILSHEQSGEELRVEYVEKYVSKYNPRIYKNNRRVVKRTGDKTYMGVRVHSLTILTYINPIDPVDDYFSTMRK